MKLTPEHDQIRRTVKHFIDEHINPYVEEWEAAEIFPAHEVFKKMGDLGLLGLNKPEAYGGMGLDYSYAAVLAEALADIDCGGVPMAIGSHTDMATLEDEERFVAVGMGSAGNILVVVYTLRGRGDPTYIGSPCYAARG